MIKRSFLIGLFALGLIGLTSEALADWSAAQRITWTSGDSYDPAVAIDSNDAVHVVWYEDTPGNDEIFYKNSPDGGTTWSAAQRLSWTTGYSWHPAIAIDSNDAIHVVWHDSTPGDGNTEIYYKRSTDGGTTWGSAKRLSWTSGPSRSPAIATGSSEAIHVVWYDTTPGNEEIYYKSSKDGGATWSYTKRLTWTSGRSYSPAIASSSSNRVHVVWTERTPDNAEIYYKQSDDGGTTWNTARRRTWTSGSSYVPALSVDSAGTVHLVWYDETPGNFEIYYKGSDDGGATWTAARRITWTADASEEPTIAIDPSDNIYVAWDDDTPGLSEVYYKRSTDGGATWSAAQRLTWTSGWSGYPAMAADSTGTIHIIWEDDTPDYNYELYYKKGT